MDQFDTWTRLLALAQQHKTKATLREAIHNAKILIHETEPHSGYYRGAAVKDGPLLPIAIWRDGDGKLQVLRGGETVPLERVWTYCAWHPISYEWYEAVAERGEKWPDAVDITVKAGEPTVVPAGTIVGGVVAVIPEGTVAVVEAQPAELDEAAKAKAEIEAAVAVAKTITISNDDEAGAAQSLRARLNKLSGDADKRRKALMAPFETEAKKIHAVWMPLVKQAKESADGLRDGAIKTWLNRPMPQPEPEPQPETEPVATAPALDGRTVPITHNEPPPAAPMVPEPAQPTATVLKGATGRAAPIHTNYIANVTNQDALYAHVKAFPEVNVLLTKIAQRLVDAGNKNIPGVEIKEERTAA